MKPIKTALALLFFANAFNAQSQLYLGLGTGYGFGLAPVNFSSDITSNNGISTFTTNNTSFGQGIPITFFGGYKLNESLGLEMGFSYLEGTTETYTNNYSSPFGTDNATMDLRQRMLRLVPAVRLTTGTGKIKPFMRMGLSIGVLGKLTETYHSISNSGGFNQLEDEITEYSGGVSFGLNAALGLTFTINEKLSLFAEINGYGQSWAPKKGEITMSELNGVNQLPNMSIYQKEIEFVKEYTSSGTFNPNVPDQSTLVHFPVSSIGLQVGVIIHL